MCIHPRAIPHLSTGRQGGGGHDPGSQAPEAPPANLGLTELFSETRSISTQRNRSHFLLISFLGAICTRLQIVLCTVILAELQTIRKDFHLPFYFQIHFCINQLCGISSPVDNKKRVSIRKQTTKTREASLQHGT